MNRPRIVSVDKYSSVDIEYTKNSGNSLEMLDEINKIIRKCDISEYYSQKMLKECIYSKKSVLFSFLSSLKFDMDSSSLIDIRDRNFYGLYFPLKSPSKFKLRFNKLDQSTNYIQTYGNKIVLLDYFIFGMEDIVEIKFPEQEKYTFYPIFFDLNFSAKLNIQSKLDKNIIKIPLSNLEKLTWDKSSYKLKKYSIPDNINFISSLKNIILKNMRNGILIKEEEIKNIPPLLLKKNNPKKEYFLFQKYIKLFSIP